VPTYQYACTACEHRFEAVQKFTDDSLTVCPECAGSLRKVYGSIGVVFKGSGFYRTDSRGGPVAPGADSGAKSENSAEKASKPAEKSTTSSDSGTSAAPAKKAEPSAPKASKASTSTVPA